MPRADSVDLRERSLRALASGMAVAEIVPLFAVSRSSLSRWRRQQRTTGHLTPGRSSGRPRAIPAAQEDALVTQVTAQPDATLVEQCAQWATGADHVPVSPTTMGRALQRVALALKKRP